MNVKRSLLLLLVVAALALPACRERTDRSEGTVLLSVSDFDGLPVVISVTAGPTQIDSITISNVVKDPSGATSALMDVEIRSYEVRYRRRDTGTVQPPPLVEAQFGVVPVGGTMVINNLPFIRLAQLSSRPLSDLADFGRDSETGSAVIPLDVTMRFFGRTLSGDDIASAPASFTIEVVP
jgi:hypothetical protein